MNVQGKVALITGGATGLGRATSLALARLGCSIAINHVAATRDEAEKTADEVRSLGVSALTVEADVTDSDACRRMAASVFAQTERLDILVNCAGVTRFIPHAALDDVKDEDWDFILGVNLKGTFHSARACRDALNINATGSCIPYAISKAGVMTLTTALARVMAPRIRVNAVAPGFIEGRWMREGLADRYTKSRDTFADASALGRVCQPEDVADAIVSLITGSDMVTGHTLVCDGGALLADPATVGVRG